MKKQFLAFLLAAVMVVSLLPVTAFARTSYDLSITKNGAAATENVDYYWNGPELCIDASDLTVTGTTTDEHIYVNSGVSNLTIEDLQANYGSRFYDSAIFFEGSSELILKGENSLSGVELDSKAVCSYSNITISGDGNLTALFPNCCILLGASANLTLSCSGNIVIDSSGYHGMYIDGTINVESTIGKLLVYGDYSDGAIGFGTIDLADGISLKGSKNYQAEESEINTVIDCTSVSGKLTLGDFPVKSVLVSTTSYNVGFAEGITNGTVTADKTSAKEGETVTVTAIPDKGYVLKEVTCWVEATATATPPEVILAADGTATFTMPASNVYIAAVFVPEDSPEAPTTPPTGDTGNMVLWIMIAVACSMGLCACLVLGKKKEQ